MAPTRLGLSLRWVLSLRVVSFRGHFGDVDHPFASFHFHNCFQSARLSRSLPRTRCGLMDARLDSAFIHGEMISSSFSVLDHVSLLDSWIMDGFKALPCPGSLLLKSVLREVLIYWDWSHIICVSFYAPLFWLSHGRSFALPMLPSISFCESLSVYDPIHSLTVSL